MQIRRIATALVTVVGDLTGHWYRSESKVFDALVAAVGVDTVEAVLLYHVVPGATVTKKDAVKGRWRGTPDGPPRSQPHRRRDLEVWLINTDGKGWCRWGCCRTEPRARSPSPRD